MKKQVKEGDKWKSHRKNEITYKEMMSMSYNSRKIQKKIRKQKNIEKKIRKQKNIEKKLESRKI